MWAMREGKSASAWGGEERWAGSGPAGAKGISFSFSISISFFYFYFFFFFFNRLFLLNKYLSMFLGCQEKYSM
jgi:hypothetical protein